MKYAIVKGKIYTVNKEEKIIDNGTILIKDGKIEAILEGDASVSEDYKVINAEGNHVLPGFIDSHTHQGLFDGSIGWAGFDGNEMTDPNTALVRAIDAINPEDPGLVEARIGGVTAIQTGPGSGNVIGGTNSIIKTYCKSKIIDDLLVKTPSSLKAALGENPKRVYGTDKKLPSTRMGTAAVFRKAFVEAQNYAKKWEEYELKKKKAEEKEDNEKIPSEPERDLSKEILVKMLNKEMPINFHCHQANDIVTAIRLTEEFDIDLVLIHATEGHKIADYIAKKDVPCSIGPSLVGFEKVELRNITFETPYKLWKAGIKISIQSDSFTRLRYFSILPCMAYKEGLPLNEALKAVTINAAEMINAEDRIGSLEIGKDADIVIWTDHPIENFYAKNKLTFINGEIAYNIEDEDK